MKKHVGFAMALLAFQLKMAATKFNGYQHEGSYGLASDQMQLEPVILFELPLLHHHNCQNEHIIVN
ncbi:MAG: hypothetical protein GC179_04975 [Anaerolineaceae bacterium]|nr:hypothetical protein [Anaerolineaceae bacterium]